MTTADRAAWVPAEVNVEIPSVARMYDYYLGGMHNFAVDRQMADAGAAIWPDLPLIMRANRAFLRRAVRHLCAAGIDQFLDIGSGIPTAGNVHEIAQAVNPQARVAYVDIDPVAVAHSRAILAGNPHATVTQADLRDVDRLLANPDITTLLDFDRPIAVLVVAVLHFLPDSANPAGVLARLHDAVAPDSYLAVSHFSNEGPAEQVEQLLAMSRRTPTPLTLRSKTDVSRLLEGWDLIDPGIVYLPLWRPDDPADIDAHPERFNDFAAVAHKS